MPAKPSGNIKTSIVHVKQKNGDTYVVERQSVYLPEKKYNKILSSRLIAKIPKGESVPVATRPKRRKDTVSEQKTEIQTASRMHVGMMDIIHHIGTVSGIDAAVYDATDRGTAQKILSLARYLLASNGQSLPGIQTWQFNHPLPYEYGITEDIYHDLFANIGTDEEIQQKFFQHRCENIGNNDAIAYDSTTISTYSEHQNDARYGFNKADDGLKTIKLLTLYSIDTRQPLAFTKQPGNLPDVITISNALTQLNALGVRAAEIVTDNGYYSEKNLSEMLQKGFDFITLIKISIKWVKAAIDNNIDDFNKISSTCPYDPWTHGISVMQMRQFEKTRKYASHKTGAEKGSTETFRRRIYLHLYFNQKRQSEDRVAFETDLMEIKSHLEKGLSLGELSDQAQKKAKKYLVIRTWGQKTTVSYKEDACKEAYRYHGYFALVSNTEKDCFECLRKYRKRETIESFFQAEKQCADGTRTRVWGTDTLRFFAVPKPLLRMTKNCLPGLRIPHCIFNFSGLIPLKK